MYQVLKPHTSRPQNPESPEAAAAAAAEIMQVAGTAPAAEANNPTPTANYGGIRIENCYVFKSRLQDYALKANLPTPEYHTLKEGPAHEPVFMSTVVINGNKYDSLPGFFTRKSAEQSAAEIALMEIVKSAPANGSIPAVQETGLCKNLLQEYALKMNYAIPSYTWNRQASGRAPSTCTVEIGGIQYIGAAARSKKEAEIKAARTALLAIHGQLESRANSATKFIVVPCKKEVRKTEKKPIETPKPLKLKNGGFKNKWNKRKFMKKNGQAADVEKDQPRVAADVIIQVSPCSQQSAQEPSSDAVMLQPDEEAMRIEQETCSDTAILRHGEDARRVEKEPSRPSVTSMLQPSEEASRVEHDPCSDAAMLQTSEGARRVEPEPPRHTAIMLSNGEGININQEPLIETVKSAMPWHNKEARTVKHDSPANSEEPPSNAATTQPNEQARTVSQEPSVENSESVYERKNLTSENASETDNSVGDMRPTGSDFISSSSSMITE